MNNIYNILEMSSVSDSTVLRTYFTSTRRRSR